MTFIIEIKYKFKYHFTVDNMEKNNVTALLYKS